MLTTLLSPTGGAATVAGHDLISDPAGVRGRCGYVAQSGGVDPHVTVREELVTQGRLYRLGKATRSRARPNWPRASASTTCWTAGRPRCPAASAAASTSRWVSPTARPCSSSTSRPPGSTRAAGRTCGTWSAGCGLRDEFGTTVVLTTHYLDEADALADRLVVVDKGLVVAEGAPAALKTEHAGSPHASLHDTFLAITGRSPAAAEAAPVSLQDPRCFSTTPR